MRLGQRLERRQTETVTGQKVTQIGLLLKMVDDLELFSTPQGEGYAAVPVRGHRENHRVDGKGFKDWLRRKHFELTGTVPRPQTIQEAVAHFDAMARYENPKVPVFIRVAEVGESHYLDLADQRWQAVKFCRDGWRVGKNPLVKFRRLPGMLPLPIPIRGGHIGELKRFLNLRTEDDWVLFVTGLLAALLASGPYPVVGIHGEAGSAKTTTSRVFRTMVDPNISPSRAMPRDIHDLMIMAGNSWVLSFDNLSYLPRGFRIACAASARVEGFPPENFTQIPMRCYSKASAPSF